MPGGPRWFQMVPDGSRWFQMVAGGARCLFWVMLATLGSISKQKIFLLSGNWALTASWQQDIAAYHKILFGQTVCHCVIIITILIIITTRPRPAFGRLGLGRSSGGKTLGDVSTPRFAPSALSSTLKQYILALLSQSSSSLLYAKV